MAAEIPDFEPLSFTAGDTVEWTRSDLSDFPATEYTLTYWFYFTSKSFSVVAAANGSTYSITITAATSAAYTIGKYRWDAFVSKGSGASAERYKVDSGYTEIKKDVGALTSGTGYNYSSTVKTIFDAIEAVIQGRASKDQESFSIAGRSLNRTPLAELIKMRNFYWAQYQQELQAEAIELGDAPKGKIRVKFIQPT